MVHYGTWCVWELCDLGTLLVIARGKETKTNFTFKRDDDGFNNFEQPLILDLLHGGGPNMF